MAKLWLCSALQLTPAVAAGTMARRRGLSNNQSIHHGPRPQPLVGWSDVYISIWYCGAWKHLGCRNTYVIKQVMWLVLVHFVIWNGNRKHGDCSSHAAVWHQHHREPRPGWHQNRQAFIISIILESSPSLELSTLTINTVTSKILLWNWIIRPSRTTVFKIQCVPWPYK